MSAEADKPGGWRDLPMGRKPVRRNWHAGTHSRGMSVRARRGLFGLLTLGCAGLLVWLLTLWVADQVPQARVLTFGVSDYQSSAFPRNPFGEQDARAFARLESAAPRQFDVVDMPNRLTGGEILKAVSGNLQGKNLIVFCNLFGRVAADASGSELEAQFYGINADGRGDIEPVGDERDRKMVSFRSLLQQCRQTQARQILILVESGQLGPNWPLGVLTSELASQIEQEVQASGVPNVSVICSAAPFEKSHVLPSAATSAATTSGATTSADTRADDSLNPAQEGLLTDGGEDYALSPVNQSVFTYYVLEGISGKADGWGPQGPANSQPANGRRETPTYSPRHHARNRRVDTDELHAYVAQQVSDWVRREAEGGVTQTVQRFGSATFDLATVSQKRLAKAVKVPQTLPTTSATASTTQTGKPAAAAGSSAKSAPAPSVSPSASAPSKTGKAGLAKSTTPGSTDSSPPFDSKPFAAVLFEAAVDDKAIEAARQALTGTTSWRRQQQKRLADWLLVQASEAPPEEPVFNAQPLLALIDEGSQSSDFVLLKRLLTLEQTPQSPTSWLSERARRALHARRLTNALLQRAEQLPVRLQAQAQLAVQSIIAAERWLLISATSSETLDRATKWYDDADARRTVLQADEARYAAAMALETELSAKLPELARRAADRGDREVAAARWADLDRLAIWQAEHVDVTTTKSLPLEILNSLPDLDSRELLRLMRNGSRLRDALAHPPSDAEFRAIVDEAAQQWKRLPQGALPASSPINPELAGVWQGFWAIETLRFQGLSAEETARLWREWQQVISTAADAATSVEATDAAVRLARARLGAQIQEAWASTTGPTVPSKSTNPAVPGRRSTSPPASQEFARLRQELAELHRQAGSVLQLSTLEGRFATDATGTGHHTLWKLNTTQETSQPYGEVSFQLQVARPAQATAAPLKICVISSPRVRLESAGMTDLCFDLPPAQATLDLTARFTDRSVEGETLILAAFLAATQPGESDFPLEIRQLRLEPPFDPSQWRVVFRTEKNVVADRPAEKGAGKLFLPPSGEVQLQPYVVGPVLPGVTSVDVQVFRLTADAEIPLAEANGLSFSPVRLPEQPGAVTANEFGEAKIVFSLPAPASPKAEPGTPAPAPAAPPQLDVTGGLKFLVTPQGHPPVEYRVPFAFYSMEAFTEVPRPTFQDSAILIPVQRKPFNPGVEPLLARSVTVQLELSPALAALVVQSSPQVELKPDDPLPKVMTIELSADQKALLPEGEMSMSLSVAGQPHAWRWIVSPRSPRSIRLAPTPAVRVLQPRSATAYFRKSGQLHEWRDGEAKPVDLNALFQIDAPEIDDGNLPGPWKLIYEMQDRGSQLKDSVTWTLSSSLNRSVVLELQETGWKLTTTVQDFLHPLPTTGLKGRFRVLGRLARPGISSVTETETEFSIDETPPAVVRLHRVPETHPVDSDLRFQADVSDPESGIYSVVAGVDLNQNRKLDDDAEKLPPILNPPPKLTITIPKNRLPPMGGLYNVIVQATNQTRVQSTDVVSERIEFRPPMRPLSETTGTLLIQLDRVGDSNTWTITGPSGDSIELPAGTAAHEFKLLDPGEYDIEVTGYNYTGIAKRKVEAGKVTTVKLKMQRR